MRYVEEREFTLRLEVKCEFPDDYQGEEDGYEWVKEMRSMAADVVQGAVAAIRRHPGWAVRPGNRGRPSDEEVTLVVEKKVGVDVG